MKKVNGFKVLKTYSIGEKLVSDLAIFGQNSIVLENWIHYTGDDGFEHYMTVQICESIQKAVPYDNLAKFGEWLNHNFINELYYELS